MKKILFAAFTFLSVSAASAQSCPANDSTSMGAGLGNDVYYSLKKGVATGNGTVKTVANNNWHLAISVQNTAFPSNPANGVAIRVNSPLGENSQTGATGTKLVKLNGANASNWRSIDTTGISALPGLIDSDSTWNLSAFTTGYPKGNPFDFIWGTYNQNNKNVEGNGSVYVLYNKTADWYKKISVKELVWDSMWHIVISNVDNTDSVYLEVNKRAYKKRLFVYYNVLTNQLIDREPDSDQWDLVWTKYKAIIDFQGGKVPYSVSGVLSNPKVKVAKNLGKTCDQVWLSNRTATAQSRISQIGHDWKTFTGMAYAITDTFVYFVDALDTNTYKMTMKSFTGGSQGKTTFNFYEATLSTESPELSRSISVYPNPSSGMVQIASESAVKSVVVYDLQGKPVISSSESSFSISALSSGVYLMLISTENGLHKQTIVKH